MLLIFKEEFGHCNVPLSRNRSLGDWCKKTVGTPYVNIQYVQCTTRKETKNRFSQDRIEKLFDQWRRKGYCAFFAMLSIIINDYCDNDGHGHGHGHGDNDNDNYSDFVIVNHGDTRSRKRRPTHHVPELFSIRSVIISPPHISLQAIVKTWTAASL